MTDKKDERDFKRIRLELKNTQAALKEASRRIDIIKERAIVYRGQIINEVTLLERQLDAYIATYFCDNWEKVSEFANIILGASRISLDGKRKLFDTLIKIQNPKFFETYKSFNTNMNTVLRERNAFAHNMIALSDEALESYETTVNLQKFGVTNRTEPYNDEVIKSILSIIKKCSTVIHKAARPRIKLLHPPSTE